MKSQHTSVLTFSALSWMPLICVSMRLLLCVSKHHIPVHDGSCDAHISFSMNSRRPLTAMTASVLSCFSSTGPICL